MRQSSMIRRLTTIAIVSALFAMVFFGFAAMFGSEGPEPTILLR